MRNSRNKKVFIGFCLVMLLVNGVLAAAKVGQFNMTALIGGGFGSRLVALPFVA